MGRRRPHQVRSQSVARAPRRRSAHRGGRPARELRVRTGGRALGHSGGGVRSIDAKSVEPTAVEAGTYRIPRSAWSLTDFAVTLPEGWTVQYGQRFAKHADEEREVSVYVVTIDEVYTEACRGDGVPEPVGPGVDALVDALSAQRSLAVSEPTTTSRSTDSRDARRSRRPAPASSSPAAASPSPAWTGCRSGSASARTSTWCSMRTRRRARVPPLRRRRASCGADPDRRGQHRCGPRRAADGPRLGRLRGRAGRLMTAPEPADASMMDVVPMSTRRSRILEHEFTELFRPPTPRWCGPCGSWCTTRAARRRSRRARSPSSTATGHAYGATTDRTCGCVVRSGAPAHRRARGPTDRRRAPGLHGAVDDVPVPDPALLAAVRALPPKQRAVVVLFYLEDLP